METLIILIIITFWAFLCHQIAIKNGRDKNLAIFLGIFFGLFAVIGYLIIGETETKKIERIKKITKN
jgi:hypothetical protein